MNASHQSPDSAEHQGPGLAPHALGGLQDSAEASAPRHQQVWRPDSVAIAADEPYVVKTRQREEFDDVQVQPKKSTSPMKLSAASWKYALKRTLKEFGRDQCTDLAAGLPYYAVLSVFPAMIAFVSILSIVGEAERTQEFLLDMLS